MVERGLCFRCIDRIETQLPVGGYSNEEVSVQVKPHEVYRLIKWAGVRMYCHERLSHRDMVLALLNEYTSLPGNFVEFATIRECEDDYHIECRFADGQKYAAVTVDIAQEKMAHDICDFLNKTGNTTQSALQKVVWRPESEWNEDIGESFWTRFPIVEPYYAGSPISDDWPGYHTHFIPMSVLNDIKVAGNEDG